ncbi:MAG: ATPase [Thermoleophilia bacterium]|nr:ATPase [Thermoleophilia bacterium]
MTADVLDSALVAQPRALRTLERLVEEGRAHALLLSGRAGSGPAAAAAVVAQRVLCPNGGRDGCDVCARVARRVHPDLHWVAPEGGSLAIDQVRRVVDVVTRMPFEADAQVVVIESADTLSSDNADAGNSLLKALEEPAGRVVFVLLAERPARVLPTIRSRAIEVAFHPIPDHLLVEALRHDGLDEATAAAATGLDLAGIARAARGDLQRARSIAAGDADAQRRGDMFTAMYAIATSANAPSFLAERVLSRASAASEVATRAATIEFEAMLEHMDAAAARSFKAKSNDDGMEKRTARRARKARVGELRACLDDLASWWRDVLAASVGAPDATTNSDRLAQTQLVADGPGGSRAVAALDAIDEAAARLQLNNADEPVTIGALAAELAALAGGRIRARRTLGAPARTPAGYDLSLG